MAAKGRHDRGLYSRRPGFYYAFLKAALAYFGKNDYYSPVGLKTMNPCAAPRVSNIAHHLQSSVDNASTCAVAENGGSRWRLKNQAASTAWRRNTEAVVMVIKK